MVRIDNNRERIVLASFLIELAETFKKSDKYSELVSNLLDFFYINNLVEKDNELEILLSDIKKENSSNLEAKKVIEAYNSSIKRENNDKTNNKLQTIFSTISLKSNNNVKVKNSRYNLGELEHHNIFPSDIKEYTQKELDGILEKFVLELKAIEAQDFNTLYSNILDISKKYLWAVPVQTGDTIVSAYDSLKTTLAISVALEKSCNSSNEFILIAGDISGIQKY